MLRDVEMRDLSRSQILARFQILEQNVVLPIQGLPALIDLCADPALYRFIVSLKRLELVDQHGAIQSTNVITVLQQSHLAHQGSAFVMK
jgi:hypothetical protein